MSRRKKKSPAKVRRFEVYLDKNFGGSEPETEIVEVPSDATDQEITEACADCLNTMISNSLDTGWYEIDAEGNPVE